MGKGFSMGRSPALGPREQKFVQKQLTRAASRNILPTPDWEYDNSGVEQKLNEISMTPEEREFAKVCREAVDRRKVMGK